MTTNMELPIIVILAKQSYLKSHSLSILCFMHCELR